jgi:hypothetical protein
MQRPAGAEQHPVAKHTAHCPRSATTSRSGQGAAGSSERTGGSGFRLLAAIKNGTREDDLGLGLRNGGEKGRRRKEASWTDFGSATGRCRRPADGGDSLGEGRGGDTESPPYRQGGLGSSELKAV